LHIHCASFSDMAHSFHWHVQNLTIPCHTQELFPFHIPFPSTLFHQLVIHPPSLHLATYFLVYLSALLFTNSYIKLATSFLVYLSALLFTNSYIKLATSFLVYFSILLFPNSYIILLWEFYFLPFCVQDQSNTYNSISFHSLYMPKPT